MSNRAKQPSGEAPPDRLEEIKRKFDGLGSVAFTAGEISWLIAEVERLRSAAPPPAVDNEAASIVRYGESDGSGPVPGKLNRVVRRVLEDVMADCINAESPAAESAALDRATSELLAVLRSAAPPPAGGPTEAEKELNAIRLHLRDAGLLPRIREDGSFANPATLVMHLWAQRDDALAQVAALRGGPPAADPTLRMSPDEMRRSEISRDEALERLKPTFTSTDRYRRLWTMATNFSAALTYERRASGGGPAAIRDTE
jgi:hypothetical protein